MEKFPILALQVIENPSHIALLFFSRSAQAEARHKQWLTDGRNEILANTLVGRSLETLTETGLSVYHYHEGNQCGATFGDRLAQAYSEVFALGYEAVIAVGNDTPELDQTDWQAVVTKLAQGQNVLGPSLRGGAYLIGLTRAGFDAQRFRQLPWQSDSLYQALQQYCQRSTLVFTLAARRDVNSLHDIRSLLREGQLSSAWIRVLRKILTVSRSLSITPSPRTDFHRYTHAFSLRGPPARV